jgi:hypothetical protein
LNLASPAAMLGRRQQGGALFLEDAGMKVTIEVDCTPLEARSFFGLPDVTVLNDHLVQEMKNRMDANISMLQPEELMRSWMTFGGQAQEQFMRMMLAATSGKV